jgi:hypothetical protein
MARDAAHNRTDNDVIKIMAVHAKVGTVATRERFGMTKGGMESVMRRFAKMQRKSTNPGAAGNPHSSLNLAGDVSPCVSGLFSTEGKPSQF